MSHEFAPQAPAVIGTESRTKSPDVCLDGTLAKYQDIAKKRYEDALSIAERIDDKMETSIPFNKNAVQAARMLTLASLRGAEIA